MEEEPIRFLLEVIGELLYYGYGSLLLHLHIEYVIHVGFWLLFQDRGSWNREESITPIHDTPLHHVPFLHLLGYFLDSLLQVSSNAVPLDELLQLVVIGIIGAGQADELFNLEFI